MNTRGIECFLTVCQEGSISKAADKLFITVQGLSKIIQKIEAELGCQVFLRERTGIKLTEEGKIFEKHAQKILQHMVFVNQEIENNHHKCTGKLNLAASYGLIGFFKPTSIITFRERNPDVDVKFREFTDEKVMNSIWYGESEMGLTYTPVNMEKFATEILCRNELFLVVNRQNPLSRKAKVTFEDLKNQKFVLQNEGFRLHQAVVEKCQKAGFEPEILFETNGICMCARLCKENIAVSVGTPHMLREIRGEDVILVPFQGHSFCQDIAMTWKKEAVITNEMQLFQSFIRKWVVDYQIGEKTKWLRALPQKQESEKTCRKIQLKAE